MIIAPIELFLNCKNVSEIVQASFWPKRKSEKLYFPKNLGYTGFVASNRIGGANIGRYDAQHLRVTQRQVQHVAPHVLRDLKAKYELDLEDLDVEEFLALLTQDELQLSEEAMDILKKFKKRKKKPTMDKNASRPISVWLLPI